MTVREAFRAFDEDGSGALSVKELRHALSRPGGGCPLTVKEITELIAEFDTDGDGELQYAEFENLWAPQPSSHAHHLGKAFRQHASSFFSWTRSASTSSRSTSSFKRSASSFQKSANGLLKTATASFRKATSPRRDTTRRGGTPQTVLGLKPAAAPHGVLSSALGASATPSSVGTAEARKRPLASAATLRALAQEQEARAAKAEARRGPVDKLPARIGGALVRNGMREQDLARLWDVNGDGEISKMEVGSSLASPGHACPEHTLRTAPPPGSRPCDAGPRPLRSSVGVSGARA